MQSIRETNFSFPNQKDFYRGKVRDVYIFEQQLLMVATDRISAFDVILPEAIPYKGQVLNQLSWFFLEATRSIVPNWAQAQPDPNVSVGLKCQPLPIEMVIRGHLAGSAWRAYRDGQRLFNVTKLPEGLRENDPLPEPMITPSTKAEQGQHDEEISQDEIIQQGLVEGEIYEQIAHFTKEIFKKGQAIASECGLILADTKYEFGLWEDQVYLIDEIHTPDSARYFDREGFEERQASGQAQPHRSKEKVRQWLISQGFQGRKGEAIPLMEASWIQAISEEYIALYEQLTSQPFQREKTDQRLPQMEKRIQTYLISQENSPKTQ